MTIEDISHSLDMSWNRVKEIEKSYLKRHFSRPDLTNVRYIAIDEYAVSRGHEYMTVVMDLDSKRVLYVGEGRSQESLKKFWKRVKKNNVPVQAVAMDMWPAYISSVMNNCPGMDIVFNHFHIIKMLNKKLDEIRRDLYRDEKEYNKRDVLKGTRWLLLKNSDNLTDRAKERLEEVLEVNKFLASAYYLKEELKLLWSKVSLDKALGFLKSWVAKAYETGLFKLREFANTLMAHRSGIINRYKHYISTGPLEGLNNKIKVLKRKAYGYRDMEFFRLKIYALHLSRYELL